MTDQEWLARYLAQKRGVASAPPPQSQPQPVYQQPPQQPVYQQPPPPGYQQPPVEPIPGAPPHAPYGYDRLNGQPLAPYGRDHLGNIIVYYPQPAHDARGQVSPQGYGQPPYGAPQQAAMPPTEVDPNTRQPVVHAMDAVSTWQGKEGVRHAQQCPECGGTFMPVVGGGKVLNVKTGEFASPAGHCVNCGFNGIVRPGETTGALAGAAQGVKVNVVGSVAAPGAQTHAQAASLHGLPNLFAPKG